MQRTRYRPPSDPTAGLLVTCLASAPYLADALKSFPRSLGHDIVLGIVLTLIWGTYFCWEVIRKHLPAVHHAVRAFLTLLTASAIVGLYFYCMEPMRDGTYSFGMTCDL
jgi:hypothetical protein